MKNTKAPPQTRANGNSFRGSTNSMNLNGLGLGGMRDVIVKLAMINMNLISRAELVNVVRQLLLISTTYKTRKAAIRMAHANPTSTIKRCT